MTWRKAPREKHPLPPATAADVLVETIGCWLIAAGILLAMRQLFRFENPLYLILLRPAAILAVLAMITRRWWHTLAAVTLFVALGGLYLFFSHQTIVFVEYLRGLIAWWIDLFPKSSSFNTDANIQVVQWLIALGISVLVYALMRGIRSFALMAALSGALFFVIIDNGFRANRLALCFVVAGTLPLLIRSNLRQMTAKLDRVVIPRRRILTAGLALCLLCAWGAYTAVPVNTARWKNPALADLLDRARATQDELGRLPISLESMGLQPSAERLGGDIHLKHKRVLKVSTDYMAPLKGRVYTEYTGKGWLLGDDSNFVISDNTKSIFSTAQDLAIPRGADGGNPLQDAFLYNTTKVTLMYGGYTLYNHGRVYSISQVTDPSITDSPVFLFNLRAELLSQTRLPIRSSYRYASLQFNRSVKNIAERIQQVEIVSALDKSWPADTNYATVAARYLQLPDKLPASVSKTAAEVTQGVSGNYARMTALESYLKTHFMYTLTPGSVPADKDFVAYFLESGKGYCTYYASAMAVMARTLGVPSRFVVGYGLVAEGDDYAAYTDNAHAWVECYFRGVGWIAFDPTGGTGYSPTLVRKPQVGQTEPAGTTTNDGAGGVKTTTTKKSTTKKTTTTTTTTTAPEQKHPSAARNLWPPVFLGVLLVLGTAFVLLRIQRQRTAYSPETVQQRFSDNARRAEYYYTDMLRQLRLMGYPAQKSETIRQHARRVKPEIVPDGGELEAAFQTVMAWRYGAVAPTGEELDRIAALHASLEARLRKTMSPIRYVVVRRLLGK